MKTKLIKLRKLEVKVSNIKTKKCKEKYWDQIRQLKREIRLELCDLYSNKTLKITGQVEDILGLSMTWVKDFIIKYYDGSAYITKANKLGYNLIKIDLLRLEKIEIVDDTTELSYYPNLMVTNTLFVSLRF
jgi:hypothetical protein